MPVRKSKKTMKNLSDVLKMCKISTPPSHDLQQLQPNAAIVQSGKISKGMVVDNNQNETLTSQSQQKNTKVPPIFLHKPVDFELHVRKVLMAGVNFYQPHRGKLYTKIICLSFEDHRRLIQYFKTNKLPYHTYSNPTQRKIKVVIRGLPLDTSLVALKEELKSIGVPVVRVHKMHTKSVGHALLVLAVVPNSEEGRKLMQVRELFDIEVKMELPITKTKQCHRCQKWGHSQRYCHGEIKCVKCAGDHVTSKCTRDRNIEPPKCANCGGEHTASYKKCPSCPESDEYKKIQNKKKEKVKLCTRPVLVTLQNYQELYGKVPIAVPISVPTVTKFEEVF